MKIRKLIAMAIITAGAIALSACGGGRSASGTNLVVSGTGPTDTVTAGGSVVFTMTVTNIGSHDATDLVITDGLRTANLTGITCTAQGGAICPTTLGTSMNVPSLNVGGSLVFTITGTVEAQANLPVVNTMTATIADDVDRVDNTATVQVNASTVVTNVVVTGTGPTATVTAGDTVVFTMTVANAGSQDATDLVITDALRSANLTGITCAAQAGAICPATLSSSMNVPLLNAGGSLVFSVTGTVEASANLPVVNTMTVTAANDTNRDDNTYSLQVNAVTPISNLVVGGLAPAAPVDGGGSAVFVMTVRNDGPAAATGVRIVDTVGSNLTLTGVACTASGGAVCPAVLGVSMDAGTLPNGGSLSFDVTTKVAIGTNGAIANTIEVSADNDSNRNDNKFVAVGNSEANNVGVTASAPSGSVVGGSQTIFTMVVSNSGPATALDVDITDTLDAGLGLAGTIGCTASGGAVCPVPTGLSMRASAIPIGGTLIFTVPATVNAGTNGVVGNTMTVLAAGDSGPANNTAKASVSAVSVDLGVSESGAANVAAGSSAVFTALVANPGGAAANNLTINWNLNSAFATTNTVACTGTGGAVCPTVLGSAMTLPSLAAGRTLIFTFTVAVPSTARGALTSVVSVTGDGDPNAANNSASVTTIASDGRNGTYKAYAADGRLYDMTVDFDARTYTMAGNGQSVQKSFTADANGDYSVSATSKFRTTADLIVGGHDFGTGNLPYVAARFFGTTLNELTGTYNLATRNLATDGSALTRPGTARVAGNVLQVCETPTLVSVTQNCESGYLTSYTLTVQGDVYNATEIRADGQAPQVTSFRLASSGASKMLLGAQQLSDGSQQLRIGLPDSSALAGGIVRGASSNGDWVNIELTSTTYLFNGVIEVGDDASLERISNAGPFAMATGVRRTDGLTIYVMQASPLVVVIDAPTTPAGLMQIALP